MTPESKPRRLIVTTCGTSTLTNKATGEISALVRKFANAGNEDEVERQSRQKLADHIRQRSDAMRAAPGLTHLAALSAELNGLISLNDGQPPTGSDEHILICTDTWLGHATAKIVEDWLRTSQPNVQVLQVQDLKTSSLEEFQSGMTELVRWCDSTLPGYRTAGYQVIFNLTGGFKSVQGCLQVLAQFYADEAVYIFESGDELLRLPRLPVTLTAEATVRDQLAVFRRLEIENGVPAADVRALPNTLVTIMDGIAILSIWGEVVWKQSKRIIYADEVFPPPIDNVRFGSGFMASVADLPADRRLLVNTRIDDLCTYRITRQPLARLDFKALQGNPRPPSTHECDAWSDADARRLFGHFEDGVFVLDALGKHL